MIGLKSLLNYTIIGGDGGFTVKISTIVLIALYYMGSFLLFRFIKRYTRNAVQRGRIELSLAITVNLVSKYVIAAIFLLLLMGALNLDLKYLLALTPLLVGLGLGIQQVFNDIASGVILLIEPNIKANDIVEVDGIVARVLELGLRTSKIESRDGIVMIIPNHKLVSEKLINWTANTSLSRFKVNVGVAYGSDVEKVKNVLLQCASSHPKIVSNPSPSVLFEDFGDSSLNFSLFFWSNHLFPIQVVKSDLRFAIDEAFRKENISIPFPQRDVHIKSGDATPSF